MSKGMRHGIIGLFLGLGIGFLVWPLILKLIH